MSRARSARSPWSVPPNRWKNLPASWAPSLPPTGPSRYSPVCGRRAPGSISRRSEVGLAVRLARNTFQRQRRLRNLTARLALWPMRGRCPAMVQHPIDSQSAREKRDLASRARRLAQRLTVDADRMNLIQFAAELDKAADSLERRSAAISLLPTAAPRIGSHSTPPTPDRGVTRGEVVVEYE